MFLESLLILEAKKFEGLVGMLDEIPKTLAPKFLSDKVSQDPLKPVCPVTIIFLFLKIFSIFIQISLITKCVQKLNIMQKTQNFNVFINYLLGKMSLFQNF
mgnify:FL=1